MSVRDLLLVIYGAVWGVVVIIIAVSNHGEVPPAMWAVLSGGIAGILTAFRVDSGNGGKKNPDG